MTSARGPALVPVEDGFPRSAFGWLAASSMRTVPLMFNAGVPATEAARRLGHSMTMLLIRYANRIDGQKLAASERIARALEDGGV